MLPVLVVEMISSVTLLPKSLIRTLLLANALEFEYEIVISTKTIYSVGCLLLKRMHAIVNSSINISKIITFLNFTHFRNLLIVVRKCKVFAIYV